LGWLAGAGVMLRPMLPAKRLVSANFYLRAIKDMAGSGYG
jgi:hypothetical protein